MNFEELTQPLNLAEFRFLLERPALTPDHGPRRTVELLDRSIRVGLEVTEGFYGLYALARTALITHLGESPVFAEVPLAHLYGKAHKILNRALFAAYCEDHPAGLLPPDTLKAVQDKAKRGRGSNKYWRTFQEFFRELDKGSPPGSPYAYNAFNGGLFAPDNEIDRLTLPDELFTQSFFYDRRGKQSREMTGIFGFHVYDFTDELNVEALGVIFEQSLKDIPAVDIPVRGKGSIDITSRETHGVYYTPKEITRFMVSRAPVPLSTLSAKRPTTPRPNIRLRREGKRNLRSRSVRWGYDASSLPRNDREPSRD